MKSYPRKGRLCHLVFFSLWQLTAGQVPPQARPGEAARASRVGFLAGCFPDEAMCIPEELSLAVPTPASCNKSVLQGSKQKGLNSNA